MQNEIYTLRTILDTICKYKKPDVKKRMIFDQSPVGGLGSKWMIALFLCIPLLEYAAIFNPYVFNKLGIAQAIIFFVVFLSVVMIVIFTLTVINNTKAVKKITSSWNHYFPDIDLKLIVTSGATPYKAFFSHYEKALNRDLNEEELHVYLKHSFEIMQEENKELLDAMKNDRTR